MSTATRPRKRDHFTIPSRGRAWGEWLGRLAAADRSARAACVDRALAAYAERLGVGPPPPRFADDPEKLT
jgi:hypothetical protein